MSYLKKSKTARIVAGLVGFTMALSLFVGLGAQSASAALTSSQVQAILSLLQSFGADQATINNVNASLTGGTPSVTPPSGTVSGNLFTTTLQLGSKGPAVMQLQELLNADSRTQVSVSGAGSPGNETTTFGPATKAAVMKFQRLKGISPIGIVGPATRQALNALIQVNPPVATDVCPNISGDQPFVPSGMTKDASGNCVSGGTISGTVSASLDSSSPTQGVLIVGQSIGNLGSFRLMNNTSSEVKITGLVFNRIGVSNDSALSNVYVYDGINRLTDSATVSQGKITFNDPTGILMIPANGSKVISVRADIASGTTGQLIGVSLQGVTSNASLVEGAFPIAAGLQTVATATLGTVDFSSGAPTPTTNTSVDPQSDYVMWQKTLTVNTHDVWLKSFRLRQIGSVSPGDLGNFRFYVDGTQVGGAVALLDANNYVTFDLSALPIKITTGSHTIKMVGDIIGGTNRTFSFSLRQASDINVVDSQLNVNELATYNSSSFSALTTGDQTVTVGSLTVTKDTTSPTGNVTLQSSGVVLGRFMFKANGEAIKVENLLVYATIPSIDTASIRNGAIFANNAQVGSTQDISTSTSGTQFNLGSALVVNPGTPVLVEIRGDIYDSNGTQNFTNGTSITVNLLTGSSNAQRLKTLSYFNAPGATVSANALTVAQGSLSVSKYAAYANQQVVKPQTNFKLAEYVISTNSTEQVNLNTLTLNFNGSGSNSVEVASALQNVYIVYGGKTTAIKTTVASTSNSYSTSQTLTPGQSISVAVYGDVTSSAASNNVFSPTLDVSGQTSLSNQTVTASAVQGQTVTVKAGSITISVAPNTPPSDLVVAGNGNTVQVAAFKIFANNDTYTVRDLALAVTATAAGSIQNFTLKDHATGATLASGISFTGANAATSTATTTGLSLVIPSNTEKVIDVWATLAAVGTPGAATTSVDIRTTLAGLTANGSSGSLVGGSTIGDGSYTGYTGKATYAVKSRPVIANVTLPVTTLAAGTQTIGKISITADAAGAISWDKIVWTFSRTSVPFITYNTLALYDDSGTQISGSFATTSSSGTNGDSRAGTIAFTPTTEQQLSGARTYSLKAGITGSIVAGESISTSIASSGLAPATPHDTTTVANTAATFVWSDLSSSPHGVTSADWLNDAYVKSIPTDGQTMSK